MKIKSVFQLAEQLLSIQNMYASGTIDYETFEKFAKEFQESYNNYIKSIV